MKRGQIMPSEPSADVQEQGRVMLRLALGDKRLPVMQRREALQLAPECFPPGECLAGELLDIADDASERSLVRQEALASLERVFLLARLTEAGGAAGDETGGGTGGETGGDASDEAGDEAGDEASGAAGDEAGGDVDAPLRWPSTRRLADRLRALHEGAGQPAIVRRGALAASCLLPGDWQRRAVREALSADDDEWRTAACHCLKTLSNVEDEVLQALGDEDPTNLRLALEAAGTHGLTGAWPVTLRVLRARRADPDLRASALLTAAYLRGPAAEEWIAPFLANEDDWLRSAAELAMSIAGGQESPEASGPPEPSCGCDEVVVEGGPERRAARWLALAGEADAPSCRAERAWRALESWPDCANAWLFLALEVCPDPPVRASALEQALRLAERALGREFFARHSGRLGSHREARVYLRSRVELVSALRELGRGREAIRHCRGLLELDEGDAFSVRPLLLDLLLESGDDQAAKELVGAGPPDAGAAFGFGAVLLALRENERDPRCRQLLDRAIARNPHVPGLLTGRRRPPRRWRGGGEPGSRWEAAAVARSQGPAWRATRGAISWLRRNARPNAGRRRSR